MRSRSTAEVTEVCAGVDRWRLRRHSHLAGHARRLQKNLQVNGRAEGDRYPCMPVWCEPRLRHQYFIGADGELGEVEQALAIGGYFAP